MSGRLESYLTSFAALILLLSFVCLFSCSDEDNPVNPRRIWNPPGNLTAEAISSTGIFLEWEDNSDNEEGFEVYESFGNDNSFQLAGRTGIDTTSISLTGRQPDATYYYRVRMFNEIDSSEYSNIASVTTSHVPLEPENLTVETISGTQVQLSWDDMSDNEEGFAIEESIGGTDDYQAIGQAGSDTTSLILSGKSAGTVYSYRVRAFRGDEYSGYSNEASLMTLCVEHWNCVFGGSDNDVGRNVRQTADGGYIVVGSTYSYGSGDSDVWLIRTDEFGNEQWNSTFGGPYIDHGSSVLQTADGGYIVVGYTASYGEGDYDVWLIRVDESGNEQSSYTFGGSGRENACGIQATIDGGYLIAGSTRSIGGGDYDAWIVKTDGSCQGLDSWTFGEDGRDEIFCIQPTRESGYYMAGSTQSFNAGSSNAWLIRTDDNGHVDWHRVYGSDSFGKACYVEPTPNQGNIIVGYTVAGNADDYDAWLIKTDWNGDEQWDRTFGGAGNDKGCSGHRTPDGGYIIFGTTESFGAGNPDVWMIKVGDSGREQWSLTFGENGSDECFNSQPTADGGYIMVGSTTSFGSGGTDVWLIKVGE